MEKASGEMTIENSFFVGGKNMRRKTLILWGSVLLLSGCVSPQIVAKPLLRAFVSGTDEVYLLGDKNSWTSSAEYRFTYSASDAVPYKLASIPFAADEEFKLYCGTDWAGYNCTSSITSLHFTSANSNDPYANFKTKDAGVYDLYFTANYQNGGRWKVFAILSAESLLKQQDLNYTRTTEIKATVDYFTQIQDKNLYACITKNRTTEFIDNGLYMHDTTGTSTNSGYYTRLHENGGVNLYHYNLSEGSDYRTNADATLSNERLDSSTVTTNDFFINAHYFNSNATTIGALMQFDFDHFNYYLPANGNESLMTLFMYFVAPLFTNPSEAPIVFSGAGLKDTGAKTLSFYLYSSESNKLESGAETVFARADITGVGTTTIPFLPRYINQTI